MRWGPRSAQPDWSAGHSLARSGFLFLALLRLLARGDLRTGARTLAEEAQRVLHGMRHARLRLPGARAEAGDGVAHDAAAFGLRLAGVPELETSRQAIEGREPRHGLLADAQRIGAVGAALVERAVQALHERLALHPDQLESLVVIVHQANREVIAGRLQQRRLLGQRDLGAAVRQPGSAEPGELHPLLCPVRSDALVDLAPRHVQDAPRQRGIVGELTRLQRLLRLRQLADGLLRGEDARARGLVLGAFAGGDAEQGGDEHEAVHGSRNLNGTPSGRRRTKRAHAQSILAMVTDAVSPVKSASSPAARACRYR